MKPTQVDHKDGYTLPEKQKEVMGLDEEEEEEEEDTRDTWGRQFDFILAGVGYAVGFGNIWRFPYLCMRNGGGAFLIPYFTFLFLCGIPLYFLEVCIGQFASRGPLGVWNVSPLFSGLGWGSVVVSGIYSTYFNVIICWVLYYLSYSFYKVLPWSTCDNDWNTATCTLNRNPMYLLTNGNTTSLNTTEDSSFIHNSDKGNLETVGNLSTTLNDTVQGKTPSEEFWQFQMLELTSGIDHPGGIRWQLVLCLLAAWVMIFLCLSKGVKSSGKVVYVTATLPYILLTVLLIRGATLPGAIDGVKFYIIPEWERLTQFNVWAEACLQIFYTLGPAWGGIITMASYNRFKNNCLRDAIFISCVVCGSSFFAGFVIFSAIGFMAKEANMKVTEVITSGPGLAFIAYPEAVSKLPLPPLWSVLFFLMLLTVGIDSQIVNVETVSTACVDINPKLMKKWKLLIIGTICILGFLLGLPFITRGGLYVFQILDWYCGAFTVMVIALSECFVLCYIYGWRRLYRDIEMMLGHKPSYWWAACWCVITPCIMLVILGFSSVMMKEPTYGTYKYPSWAIYLGWGIAVSTMLPIPACMVLAIMRAEGSFLQRLKQSMKPTDSWGPDLPKYRVMYKDPQSAEALKLGQAETSDV